MTDHAQPSPVAELSYEQAREELVSIVARLESGQCTLEESMTLWERGEALAGHCERFLTAAQARIEGRPAPGSAGQGADDEPADAEFDELLDDEDADGDDADVDDEDADGDDGDVDDAEDVVDDAGALDESSGEAGTLR